MREEKNSVRTNFISHSNLTKTTKTGEKGTDHNFKYFGISKKDRPLKRFKLILASGKQVSIPYAFLPIIILEHDGCVRIKANDLDITINGRGLNVLGDYLSYEQVRWIKESVSDRDDLTSDDFISEIKIDGDLDL